MYFACTHILNIFSLVFFFLIPTFLHCFPPFLPQLIRGLILIALYALIVMYQHISLVSGLSNKYSFFFSSSVYRDYSISSIWDISRQKTGFKMQYWYMRKLLQHSNPSMVWHFTSSHPGMLDSVACCFFGLFFSCAFLFPILSHFFFSCR